MRWPRDGSVAQAGSFQRSIMRVLVSNDDGVDAPGIRVLAERLRVVGEVTVVAPDRDRSGASNSLTLDAPLRVLPMGHGYYRVAGTPTDCVHLALAGLLDKEPDMVVSGINNSANLGDDVIYSGTVSAAMEGRFLGLPAIAVSLVSDDHKGVHYDSAAQAVLLLMQRLLVDPLPADTIVPHRASRRPIRAGGRSGGSGRPARWTTPGLVRISTRCVAVSSRSRRSKSS